MNTHKMSDSFILLSVAGFVMWALFQRAYIERSSNISDTTRLLFPIIVPIAAGIIVYICYVIYNKQQPTSFLFESVKDWKNFGFLFLSALGLGFAYFFYTLMVGKDSKNIAIIPILNTLFLILIAFVVKYENDKFIIKLNASVPQIIGAILTTIGVVVMKYGDKLFK